MRGNSIRLPSAKCRLLAVVSTGRRNTLSWAGRDGMRAEKRMMSSGAHYGREYGALVSLAAGDLESNLASVW
jgi:hypothetical protein